MQTRSKSFANLRSYQDLLMGRLPVKDFKWKPLLNEDYSNEQAGLDLIRYGVEDVLGWTPQQVIQHMTPHIARTLHWDMLFARQIVCGEAYIHFDYKERGSTSSDLVNLQQINWRFLMHLCYPREIPFSFVSEAIKQYRSIYNAKMMANLGMQPDFTKRFGHDFLASTGRYQDAICSALVRIVVNEHVLPILEPSKWGTAHDLYKFFSNHTQATNVMRRAALYDLMKVRYATFYDMLCQHYDDLQVEDDFFWRKVYGLASAAQFTGVPRALKRIEKSVQLPLAQ